MKTVIAVFQSGLWCVVHNLDFDVALREAEESPEHREFKFIEDGKIDSYTFEATKPED